MIDGDISHPFLDDMGIFIYLLRINKVLLLKKKKQQKQPRIFHL